MSHVRLYVPDSAADPTAVSFAADEADNEVFKVSSHWEDLSL